MIFAIFLNFAKNLIFENFVIGEVAETVVKIVAIVVVIGHMMIHHR